MEILTVVPTTLKTHPLPELNFKVLIVLTNGL